jgi:hypothetical protein
MGAMCTTGAAQEIALGVGEQVSHRQTWERKDTKSRSAVDASVRPPKHSSAAYTERAQHRLTNSVNQRKCPFSGLDDLT